MSKSKSDANLQPMGKPLDEMPIATKNQKKTFEQMIEEELAKEAKNKLAKVNVMMDPSIVNEDARSKTPTE